MMFPRFDRAIFCTEKTFDMLLAILDRAKPGIKYLDVKWVTKIRDKNKPIVRGVSKILVLKTMDFISKKFKARIKLWIGGG